MINKRLLLVLIAFLWIVLIGLITVPIDAQMSEGKEMDPSSIPEPSATPTLPLEEGGDPSATPEPSATPALELTTAGWLEEGILAPAGAVSTLALTPVDCAVLAPPVVGYEISRGQDPNDIADFINDLTVNGFSLGVVNISGGVIPPCVDVLIVQGSTQGSFLTSSYSAADGTFLKAWAAGGHGLMLSGEFGSFRVETEQLFQAYGYSQLGTNVVTDTSDFDPAGPANSWVIYQLDNFTGHPILDGVNTLEFLAGSALSPNTNAIVTTDADADPATTPVLAAFGDGAGCVALVTDSNWNSVVGAVAGYFKQDNARAARQMVQWLNGCASLKLSKLASPSPVQAGGLLTYTLTASNDSAVAVTNISITDTVPAGATFVSASLPHAGPDANGVVTWPLNTLDPNSSATVVMVVQVNNAVPTGTLIANTAWLTSSQGLTDTATTLTPVNVQIVDPVVAKAANPGQGKVGDVVTFTLTVQQIAPSTSNATNIQVVDPLPNEVDIVSLEVNAGFTVVAGRVVTWTIPVLAPGDVRLMTIRAAVNNNASPSQSIRNQASLSFDQGPARLSNPVEILVLGSTPPTSTPTPTVVPPPAPEDDDDDDDNNDNEAASPPAPAPPAPAAVSISTPTPTPDLPVTLLPETGNQAAWLASTWFALGLAFLSIIMIFTLKRRF